MLQRTYFYKHRSSPGLEMVMRFFADYVCALPYKQFAYATSSSCKGIFVSMKILKSSFPAFYTGPDFQIAFKVILLIKMDVC